MAVINTNDTYQAAIALSNNPNATVILNGQQVTAADLGINPQSLVATQTPNSLTNTIDVSGGWLNNPANPDNVGIDVIRANAAPRAKKAEFVPSTPADIIQGWMPLPTPAMQVAATNATGNTANINPNANPTGVVTTPSNSTVSTLSNVGGTNTLSPLTQNPVVTPPPVTSPSAATLNSLNSGDLEKFKSDILSGVEAKNKQFGTEATQGFMDAFKNFQIPTNQQTGVNLGNYNDNRNAAADQWWSQYVTGRR